MPISAGKWVPPEQNYVPESVVWAVQFFGQEDITPALEKIDTKRPASMVRSHDTPLHIEIDMPHNIKTSLMPGDLLVIFGRRFMHFHHSKIDGGESITTIEMDEPDVII